MANERTIPSSQAKSVATFTLFSNGEELPRTLHLLSLNVQHEINRIPSATLILLDGEPSSESFTISNEESFKPGQEIEVTLGYRNDEESVFKGIVIKHSIKIRKGGSLLMIECRDKAVKMTGSCHSRYFHDLTDSDLIEELIDNHSLEKEVQSTSTSHTQIVQYHSTDWDMMVSRADVNGLLINARDGKVRAIKPDFSSEPVLTVQYGATIHDLDAEIDSRLQYKSLKGTVWNPADQEINNAIEAVNPEVPEAGNLSADNLAAVVGEEEFRLYHGGRINEAEMQAMVDSAMLKHRLSRIRGKVTIDGTPDVLPGDLFQLQGVGERFEGKLFVTGVRNSLEKGSWRTVIQFGLDPRWFVEQFEIQPPVAGSMLPGVSGLHIGQVVALEGDPEGEERIQVRVPIIHAEDEGAWCRLATLDAGNNRGTWFRPEIDDEVVVGFLDSDPRHAIVLGQLHSSSHPSPEPAKDDNHLKGYQSREGMKLTFDDEKKVVQLETPAGNKLVLSEDETKIAIEDQNQNKIIMDSNGISIESAKELVLKAGTDLKVQGMNVDCKADVGLKMGGSGGTELSLNGSTNLSGPIVNIN